MKQLHRSTGVELKEVKIMRRVHNVESILLTVKSAVDFPMVKGSQIPRPIVVSRMKVISTAWKHVSTDLAIDKNTTYVLQHPDKRSTQSNGLQSAIHVIFDVDLGIEIVLWQRWFWRLA